MRVNIPREGSDIDKVVVVGDAAQVASASKYIQKIVKEIIEERAAYANSDPAEDEVTNDKSGRQFRATRR